MATPLKELMTTNVISLEENTPVSEAAKQMESADIGDVLLTNSDGELSGILTDRDIVTRVVAADADARTTPCINVCSRNPETLAPEASPEKAMRLMREHAIRRVPIVEGKLPVGVVSLGDLATDRDADSLLGQISRAPASN